MVCGSLIAHHFVLYIKIFYVKINSASTQEANSNVTVYVEYINELTEQITVFESMIKNFQVDLGKYKI